MPEFNRAISVDVILPDSSGVPGRGKTLNFKNLRMVFHVEKDGEIFYWADSDLKWEEYKTLTDIEKIARRTPKSKWQVILNNPMRGATWERKRGKWILIERNKGFA